MGMWRPLLLLTCLLSLLSSPSHGQELADPRLEGRVMRLGRDSVAISGASVVLHTITADSPP
jgi:hypothetical protein